VLRDRLVNCIRADFPRLDIQSAILVTSGWDHDVVIINDDYVFRFPDGDDIAFDREIAVLEALRNKTTLAIPQVDYIGQSARYIGYRMVKGKPLTSARYTALSSAARARVARDLAEFLSEIHAAISVSEARSLGLEFDEHESYIEEASHLRTRIGDPEILTFIDDTLHESAMLLSSSAPETFLYNDLHGNNMAFNDDDERLVGVFDFGDAAYGDIHREFAPLLSIHRGLFEATVREYANRFGVALSRRRMVMWYRIERLADLAETIDQPGNEEPQRILREIEQWMANPAIYSND
jgi:aminoglycoside 2''-phosphotransferase